jgi:PQQ-dependent catabolism-associated CXXCW motif protein
MAMSTAQGGGFIPTNRRRSVLRTFLNLYRGEFVFQGMVDFALIGALVLLFLHPPSKDQLRSWLSRVGIEADQQPDNRPQKVVTAQPAPAPTPAQQPTAAPTPVPQPAPAPALTPQPAQPSVSQSPVPAAPIMFPPEIARPSLANVMLVEISDTAFRNSHAADQQRLLAARTAYRSARGGEMVEILKDADGRDPNVAFMRGLGFLIRGDEASVKAGEAALRTAVEANHTLAKVLLGRVLVTAPKGITKSVDEARRLIEAAVAAGDPQAQRVAAIAYISADFGSFEPDRAASLFKRAAEAGDPQAMFHYARVLSEGIGVPANQAAAVDFLGRAAAAGLTDAQLTLGTWLLEQYRTSALSDPTEAAAWLDRAAQRGFSPIALNRLQLLYGWTGREAPWNDKTRYLALARQCSGLAEPYCQYSYSIAFSNGWGTAKDPIRAYVHAVIARDLGNPNVNAKTIDDLGALLTTSERADATERARALRQRLKPAPRMVVFQYPDVVRPPPWASVEEIADASQPQAQPQPASSPGDPTMAPIPFDDWMAKPNAFYYWTIAFDPNAFRDRPPQLQSVLQAALAAYRDKQARKIIDVLRNADSADAIVNLLRGIAMLRLRDGENTANFEAEAARYLQAAANAGDSKAAAILGDFLTLDGSVGIQKNIPRARELAEQAAQSHDGFAVRQLAILVLSGAFGSADPSRAADLMRTAADLGDPAANVMVAAFFQNGTGLPRDPQQAEKYLRRAADLGLTEAQDVLGDWIVSRYASKQIASPEEGVRVLEHAFNSGRSFRALQRLIVLYDYNGREPPWRDQPKALELARKCAPYSDEACHISLGVVYQNLGDLVRSWAHFDVARGLGFQAAERLEGLEKSMTKSELDKARNLTQAIRRDLKPLPDEIEVQDAIVRASASAGNYADELTDWGVQPQTNLKYEVGSRTPVVLPGARCITTQDMRELGRQALVLDVLEERTGHYTIPGAIHLPGAGNYGGGRFDDRLQANFQTVLSRLVSRNPGKPIVFFCASSQCWESYNATLRAMRMGFPNVLWYRGGLASWKSANLPVTVPTEVYPVKQ